MPRIALPKGCQSVDVGHLVCVWCRWVESSFWNFDSLFQPQSHPARDAHDTFFIKDPASTLTVRPTHTQSTHTQRHTQHTHTAHRADTTRRTSDPLRGLCLVV